MKLSLIMSTAVLTIGFVQANSSKEFTYQWLVNQFKESQVDNIEHIKKHLPLYTNLVQSDVANAKSELCVANNNYLKLLAGALVSYFGIERLVRALIFWPSVAVRTEFGVVPGDKVLDLEHISLLFLRTAISSLGIYLIKDHLTTLAVLKKRIALDESILADLYALSLTR